LAKYEVFHGNWAKLFAAPGQFEKVTREEIHAVARDILERRRRTAGVLMPTSDDGEESAEADIEDADLDVSEDVEA
jgi:zinc protease